MKAVVVSEDQNRGLTSAQSTVWLAILTMLFFVVMAVSFKRWRVDLCSRSSSAHSIDDDTFSVAPSVITQDFINSDNLDIESKHEYDTREISPQSESRSSQFSNPAFKQDRESSTAF